MGDCVYTRGGGKSLGSCHLEIWVNYCHVRQQLVVRKGILYAALFICDNGKWSDLGACTCRCGDGDEVCLFAHFRECVYSLSDIHESHSHIHEVSVGMFVEHPHYLGSVHCGAAAQCDNGIGLECSHLLGTCLGAGKCGVGSYIEEGCGSNAHFVQLVNDRLCKAVFVKELVCDNEGALLVHHGFQLVKGNGQAAALQVNFLRCSEPKHIFSPLGNSLDIEQVLYSHVLADGVSAPRAAAQCQ